MQTMAEVSNCDLGPTPSAEGSSGVTSSGKYWHRSPCIFQGSKTYTLAAMLLLMLRSPPNFQSTPAAAPGLLNLMQASLQNASYPGGPEAATSPDMLKPCLTLLSMGPDLPRLPSVGFAGFTKHSPRPCHPGEGVLHAGLRQASCQCHEPVPIPGSLCCPSLQSGRFRKSGHRPPCLFLAMCGTTQVSQGCTQGVLMHSQGHDI